MCTESTSSRSVHLSHGCWWRSESELCFTWQLLDYVHIFATWHSLRALVRETTGKGSVSAAHFRCDQQRKQDTGGSVWLLASALTHTVSIKRLLRSLPVHTANAVITGRCTNYMATGGKRRGDCVRNAGRTMMYCHCDWNHEWFNIRLVTAVFSSMSDQVVHHHGVM